ncbi:MAG: hypothetical protein P4L46_11425 [Fimbriimonas sp.]|nr:hypothetical protein [Fimbriimonas sp.]
MLNLEGGEPVRFRTRYSQMLIAYLAIKNGQEVSREALIDAIWPEVDLPIGRNRLNTELSYLRSGLDRASASIPLLEVDRQFIRLRTDALNIDLVQAYGLVARSALESEPLAQRFEVLTEALNIGTQPLLSDLRADWIDDESARFESSIIQASLSLSRNLRLAGDVLSALDCVQRTLARTESEALYLAQLRLASEARRPADTVRAYERYVKFLAESQGAPASTEATGLVELARRNLAKGGTRTLQRGPDSLAPIPQPIDRFVGRERDLRHLTGLISKHRLVSLVGIGGVGKTRLMVQVCLKKVDIESAEVAWIPLTEVSDSAGMIRLIAEAFGYRDASGRGLEFVASILRERRVTLALDNFEHLPDECSQVLGQLLLSTEALRCVVTSRRQLGLTGEAVFRCRPLSLPIDGNADLEPTQCESMQFLLDRVQHVRPGYRADDQSTSALVRICRRVDGLPLALELVASRFGVLGETEIEEELANPTRLLVSTDLNREARHVSLETAVAWNYETLNGNAREVLDNLCVFAGPCDLAKLRSVFPNDQLVESLNELHGLSMLHAEPRIGRMRFSVLQTIRDVVQLRMGQGRLYELRTSHAAHFGRMTGQARPGLISGESSQIAEALDSDYVEILAAIDFLSVEDPASAIRMLVDLEHYWRMRDRQAEILPRFRKVAFLDVPESARALRAYAFLAHVMGRLDEAKPVIETAYERATQSKDSNAIAASALLLSYPTYSTNRRSLLEEAEEAAADAIAPWLSLVKIEDAMAMWQGGEWVIGKQMAMSALALAEETRCDWLIAYLVNELSYMQVQAFELLDAKASIIRYLELSSRYGGERSRKSVSPMLGTVELYLGNRELARQVTMEGIQQCRELGLDYAVANELSRLAGIEAKCLLIDDALEHETEASQMRERIRFPGYLAVTAINRARIAFYCGDQQDAHYWLRLASPHIADNTSSPLRQTYDWLSAQLQIGRGYFQEARQIAISLAVARDKQGNGYGTAEALETAALAMANIGQLHSAARLAQHAVLLRDRVHAKVPPADERWRNSMLSLIGTGLAGETMRSISHPDPSIGLDFADLLATLETST